MAQIPHQVFAMHIRKITAAIAAASLALSSGGVFAQPDRHHERSDEHSWDQRTNDHERYGRDDRRGDENRGYDRHGYESRGGWHRGDDRSWARERGSYRGDAWRHDGRGAGPEHNWYRGSRLPREYRSRYYVVDDWRAHHLYAPPHGYHWVQAGDDYVLAAIATGVIAAILLNQ
jgi:Ni/Co efflux regulator RcnB